MSRPSRLCFSSGHSNERNCHNEEDRGRQPGSVPREYGYRVGSEAEAAQLLVLLTACVLGFRRGDGCREDSVSGEGFGLRRLLGVCSAGVGMWFQRRQSDADIDLNSHRCAPDCHADRSGHNSNRPHSDSRRHRCGHLDAVDDGDGHGDFFVSHEHFIGCPGSIQCSDRIGRPSDGRELYDPFSSRRRDRR